MDPSRPADAPPDVERRRRHVVLAMATLLVVLVWTAAAGFLWRGHTVAVRTSLAWAEAQAETLSQTLLRAFEVVQALHDLVRMRQALEQAGDGAAARLVEQHLATIAAERRFGVVQVGFIRPDGVLAWGSVPGSAGTDLADREHFQVHALPGAPPLFVSRPVIGRTTGRWSVQVTRRVEDAAGGIAGVSVVSLDPVELSRMLQEQLDRPGRLAVVRRIDDGTLLARGRDPEQHLDRPPAPDHPVAQAARGAPAGHLRYGSRRDGRMLLSGYRVPGDLPLVVSAAFDEEAELAGWREMRNVTLAAAAAVTLVVLLLIQAWTTRQRLRAEQGRLARERIAAAEALARQRSEILAVMAHEIRTPLTGVLGFGELLAGAKLPPEQQRHAEVVVETGRVLLAVVNDILDLAKLEAGRISIETQPFALAEMLRQSLALSQSLASENGLRMSLETEPGLPGWVLGDATRIRQVLGNFLSNAVKFTERGSVTLRARVVDPAGRDPVRVRLEVEDTGIGIPLEDQPRLFEMFERAESGRRITGTGLGLAISRRLVDAMGGSIGVVSEVGRGSTFWCELPLRLAAPPEPVEASAKPDAGPPLDVLVVDDVATNRTLIRAYLAGAGHRVTLAEDGVQAVAAAQERRFDVILMDVNMPGMDGLEATQRLRLGKGPNALTPIVALTASTSREERERARGAGMTLHLAKPVGRVALLHTLQQVALPVGD